MPQLKDQNWRQDAAFFTGRILYWPRFLLAAFFAGRILCWPQHAAFFRSTLRYICALLPAVVIPAAMIPAAMLPIRL